MTTKIKNNTFAYSLDEQANLEAKHAAEKDKENRMQKLEDASVDKLVKQRVGENRQGYVDRLIRQQTGVESHQEQDRRLAVLIMIDEIRSFLETCHKCDFKDKIVNELFEIQDEY